jgi:hypothetical protein
MQFCFHLYIFNLVCKYLSLCRLFPYLLLKFEGTLQTIILNFEKMAGKFLLRGNVDLEAVHTVYVTFRVADYVSLKCQCFIY